MLTYKHINVYVIYVCYMFKLTSPMAQWVKNLSAMHGTQEMQIRSLGWEDI